MFFQLRSDSRKVAGLGTLLPLLALLCLYLWISAWVPARCVHLFVTDTMFCVGSPSQVVHNLQHTLWVSSLWARMYPCSTKTREVLGNPSLAPKRFPETRDILPSSIFLQEVDQKILPCGQGRIGSAEINPSLLMMRAWECSIFTLSVVGRSLTLSSILPP